MSTPPGFMPKPIYFNATGIHINSLSQNNTTVALHYNNMKNPIKGTLLPEKKKIILYSYFSPVVAEKLER